jgi:hypothetical protein
VQYSAPPAPEPHSPEPPHKPEDKPQHRAAQAPKPQANKPAERTPDAGQLPAFLLRPVPLPKTEKPAAAPRKKVPVTA